MDFSGEIKKIDELKTEIDAIGSLAPARQKKIDDYYKVEMTYSSLALSGGTLSREEVAAIVLGKNNKGQEKRSKPMRNPPWQTDSMSGY